MPLSLSGVRQISEAMDWGDVEDFIQFGEIGDSEVDDLCSYYVLVAPQNIVGGIIITEIENMVSQTNANRSNFGI